MRCTNSGAGVQFSRGVFEAAGVCERLCHHTPARGSGNRVEVVFLFVDTDGGDVSTFIDIAWFVDIGDYEKFFTEAEVAVFLARFIGVRLLQDAPFDGGLYQVSSVVSV